MSVSPEELAELTAKHNAIRDRQEQSLFYREFLFPALRDTFAVMPTDSSPIDVLLLPISSPHIPVLSVARWKPKKALMIYSSQSIIHQSFIEQEIAQLDFSVETVGKEVLNIEIEPERLYKAIQELLIPYLHAERLNPHIALDITGGTKVMSVGAAMALSLVGGRFVYLLSATVKDDIQQRQVGTEQPRYLEDPYAVFGDLEAREAIQLFREHDYAGAQRGFAHLAERLPKTHRVRYDLFSLLASAYTAWEGFHFDAATQKIAAIVEQGDDVAELKAFMSLLKRQQDALQRTARLIQDITARKSWQPTDTEKQRILDALSDPNKIALLLGGLYANALRREAQGRFDVAALLGYRCLELLSQHRLARYGILTERPDYGRALHQRPDLNRTYLQVQIDVGRRRPYDLPDRNVGLFVGYMLLAALGDEIVAGYPIKQIEDRTEARNKSILTHGYRPITSDDYEPFRTVVDEFVERFFNLTGINRSTWKETFTFVQPFR